MKVSIVSTLYRSAATVEPFYRRVVATASKIGSDVEVVLVNDGSPDDSLDRALALQRADARLVIVDLARNFGHHKAMMTGLAHAGGDLVMLIDSDLEEEPEIMEAFYKRYLQGDCDVVYGVQERRRGRLLQRAAGNLFFWLANALSDQPLPRNLVTARLMTREYVRALVRHRDREFMIAHLWQLSGFRQVPIAIRKMSSSATTYSLANRITMAVKHVTTTSTRLLHIIFYLGLLICLLSAGAILYLVARYFLTGIALVGWTSLIVAVCFFGGLTTAILGILGIYIANILSETKRRPYTIVRQVYRAQQAAAATGPNVLRVHPNG